MYIYVIQVFNSCVIWVYADSSRDIYNVVHSLNTELHCHVDMQSWLGKCNVSLSFKVPLRGWDTVYHDRFWLYGGINRPGDTYQDIRHLIEMFWTVWLIHIEYRLNMITIQIQCKYNLLCSKLYYNHTWIALTLATALTLSTSEKILCTKSFTSEKAQRFCTPNLFGCSKCSPQHHVILSKLAWHTHTSLASYYNVMSLGDNLVCGLTDS